MTRALVLLGGLGTGAFQAGVVAGLAERGERWALVAGGGAGAVNGLLAIDDRVDAMVRLWRAQAEAGVPLLASRFDLATSAVTAAVPGSWAAIDPRAIDGMIPSEGVADLVEPFTAGLAERLTRSGRRLMLPLLDLDAGEARLVDPARDVRPGEVGRAIAAAAMTAVVGAPVRLALRDRSAPGAWVDGAAALAWPLSSVLAQATEQLDALDVVLGVPDGPGRAGVAPLGLAEIASLAEGARLAATVRADLEQLRLEVRVFRPSPATWRSFTGRDDADVRLEFPGALSRNGALLGLSERYGRWLVSERQPDVTS